MKSNMKDLLHIITIIFDFSSIFCAITIGSALIVAINQIEPIAQMSPKDIKIFTYVLMMIAILIFATLANTIRSLVDYISDITGYDVSYKIACFINDICYSKNEAAIQKLAEL